MTLTLVLLAGERVYTGRQVTFQSPCNSEGLTGLVVQGVTYDLVNALGTTLVANSFHEGAMVSVVFNEDNKKAYVQNADTNAYIEGKLNNSNAHAGDKNNPHGVTAAQVGLGNVPNVSTNDQTPTYSDITTLATLTSGEKLSVAFQKIKLAITNLINHIGNKNNPHAVTASQVGAAASYHTHSKSEISDFPTSIAPTAHTHSKTEITDFPTSMTPSSHTHAASDIKAGTFADTGVIAKTGTDYTTYRIRNIAANTTDMTAKSSALTNGNIYFQYE